MQKGAPVLVPAHSPDLAFNHVFSIYRDYVYRLALALVGHVEDAEDVTQEVFVRVHKALPTYQEERAGLRTWLTGITVNACKTHRRRNSRRWGVARPQATAEPAALDAVVDPSVWIAPEDQALLGEARRALQGELARLRPEHRAVLILHYYLDFSSAEIARVLQCSEGTVCSRLYYARRRLQACLEAQRPRSTSREWL